MIRKEELFQDFSVGCPPGKIHNLKKKNSYSFKSISLDSDKWVKSPLYYLRPVKGVLKSSFKMRIMENYAQVQTSSALK